MGILIKDILDVLTGPVGVLEQTVDRLEFGDPSAEVKGVAVTFMATMDVIRHAADAGANLIISHEGIFYSHHDNKEALACDPVFQGKMKLIQESGMAVFRFHDYVHRYRPDLITAGLVSELGWDPFVKEHLPAVSTVAIPGMTLMEVAGHVKLKLGVPYVRVVGDMSMPVSRIGVFVGYRGGSALNIPYFENENLDLIIAGEGPEWETPEYVRDAMELGKKKAVLFLGHAPSEEPGMKCAAQLLQARFPSIPVRFIPVKHQFQLV